MRSPLARRTPEEEFRQAIRDCAKPMPTLTLNPDGTFVKGELPPVCTEEEAEETIRKTMRTVNEIVLAHSDKTDGTAYLFWAIVQRAGLGRYAIVSNGFWFSREAAEEHLKRCNYRFPKSAFVYCFSGHDSFDARELYELAKLDKAKTAATNDQFNSEMDELLARYSKANGGLNPGYLIARYLKAIPLDGGEERQL